MELLKKDKELFTLKRDELQEFLYQYIILKQTITNIKNEKEQKKSEIREGKAQKLKKLQSGFDDYSDHIFKSNFRKAEKINSKMWRITNKIADMKFRYYFLLVLLFKVISGSELNIPAIIFGLWDNFFVSILLSILVFILRKPLFGIIRLFIKVIEKVIIAIAKLLDYLSAKQKGINRQNIKGKYNYPSLYKKIDASYEELIDEVQEWKKDDYNNFVQRDIRIRQQVPQKVNNLGYLLYMHEQIHIGAADNWKEAVNSLNDQIRHAETIGAMKGLSKQLERNNQTLQNIDRNINRKFSELNTRFTNSLETLNQRIDGLFEGPYYYR